MPHSVGTLWHADGDGNERVFIVTDDAGADAGMIAFWIYDQAHMVVIADVVWTG